MRALRFRSTTVLATVLSSAVPASAQVASSVEIRAQASHSDGIGTWVGASVLGASIRMDRTRWSLGSTGALTSDWDRWQQSGSFSALATSPAFGPLQLSATGALSRLYRGGVIRNEATANGRASVRFGRSGAWAGIDVSHGSGTDAPDAAPAPVLGVWQQLGNALLSVQWSSHRARVPGALSTGPIFRPDSMWNDTLGIMEPTGSFSVTDTSFSSMLRSWSDAEARIVWARGRLAVDATLGGRLASTDIESSLWGQLQGFYVLTPRLALIAAAGREPADPLRGWQPQRFATFGVRLLGTPEPARPLPPEVRPAPADFHVLPVRHREYVVRVRVPNARTVELSADFTAWKPVPLARSSADWWQVTVTIVPGTHHVNIRVNGDAWTAPPGIPAVEDEFNGSVGLVVVE